MLPRYLDAQSAFTNTLQDLRYAGEDVPTVTDVTSVGSGFGTKDRPTKEIIGAGFTLSNPRARLVNTKTRPINVSYCIANLLWTLRGTADLDPIAFYNPRGRHFSRDGSHLTGAIGRRIFSLPIGSQIATVTDCLRKDPTSRRAVISLFSPEDLISPPLDTPCTLSLQYVLRNNCLIAVTYMRSQSALTLLPIDVFLFTMLQEFIAKDLGVHLGSYHHYCGSLHYYGEEEELIERVLEESPVHSLRPMDVMPESPTDRLEHLLRTEEDVRERLSKNIHEPIDVNGYGLHNYWAGLLAAMITDLRLRRQCFNLPELVHVPQTYRNWIINERAS